MAKSLMTALSVLTAVLVSSIPIFKQFSLPPSQTAQYPPVDVKLADEKVRPLLQHLNIGNNSSMWLLTFICDPHLPFSWMEEA